jgi:ABC-type branched-subunit amino acid transport system ATPase component
MILQIHNLTGGYTQGHDILQGVDLEVKEGDSIGIIGLNGSGKSTFAKALMNILPYRKGKLFFNDVDISKKSTQELSQLGIALFMQGGRVFDELSVWDNLSIAANSNKKMVDINNFIVSLSFANKRLTSMRADKLSGGERHQLALAMCLLQQPSLLILDEPSAGLSPVAVTEIYQTLDLFRTKMQLTTILIEQNVSKAVDFCSSVNMLRDGKIAYCSASMFSLANPPKNGEAMHSPENQLKEIENLMFNLK